MTKRKHSPKKSTTTSKKRGKSKSGASLLKKSLTAVTLFAIVAILMALAGWVGFEAGKEYTAKKYEKSIGSYRSDIENLRKRLKSQKLKEEHTAVTKKEVPSEVRDYAQAGGETSAPAPTGKKEVSLERPKLAIIIDDVAFPYQMKQIKALPFKITPSLFPPTSRHPNTPKLAKTLRHYMIHLPMEALNYNHAESQTLTTKSSEAEMELRLRELRHWFPKAKFINNHTGSKFTADAESMALFYPLAKHYGFIFVDSRTTPKTVVAEIAKINSDPYIGRDIFLDNKPDIKYIQSQLKKAVRIAKAQGYAIAIGHPHVSTLKALAESKEILKGVDVVYMDELYSVIR